MSARARAKSRVLESQSAIERFSSHEEHFAATYTPPPAWWAWTLVSLGSALFYLQAFFIISQLIIWPYFFITVPFAERGFSVLIESPFIPIFLYTVCWLYMSRAKTLPYCDGVAWGRSWFDIFQLKVHVDQQHFAECPGPYLMAFAPHGIVPIGIYLANSYFHDYLPGLHGRVCSASINFYFAILRQLNISTRAISASTKNMLNCLTHGASLYLVPGGIAELFSSNPKVEKICTFHKGFVRLAMKAGVPIVPVYLFGHTRLFHQTATDSGFAIVLSRLVKSVFTLYYGQYLLPIPFQTRMTVAVGRPIPTGAPNAHPGDADVDVLHAQYIAEIQRLYHQHKDEAGYGDTPLVLQ